MGKGEVLRGEVNTEEGERRVKGNSSVPDIYLIGEMGKGGGTLSGREKEVNTGEGEQWIK